MGKRPRTRHVDNIEGTLDAEADPAQNFSLLQKLPGITAALSRDIVSLLREDRAGKYTSTRPNQSNVGMEHALQSVPLPAKAGQNISFYYLSLAEVVQSKVNRCPFFAQNLKEALQRGRNTVTLLLFQDETTPGNPLRPDQMRKTLMTYGTFLEMDALFMDSQWLTLSCARTQELSDCNHGFEAALRVLMEKCLAEGHDGFPIDFDGDIQLVRLCQGLLLADLEGIRQATGCKGTSGIKPCLVCSNVLAHGRSAGPGYVQLTEKEKSLFQRRSQNSLMEVKDHLATLRGGALEEAEKLTGWHFDALSASALSSPLLLSTGFFCIENILFDAMHIYYAGLIPQELGLWYEVASQKGLTLEHLQSYGKRWTRRSDDTDSASLFVRKLWKKDKDFKGDASQSIAAIYLVASFQAEVFGEDADMHLPGQSLLSLFAVVQVLLHGKSDVSDTEDLSSLQKKHMLAFEGAYSADIFRPKAHVALHLQEQYQKWSKAIDCFACERKHKYFKSEIAPNFRRLADFSKATLLKMSLRDMNTSVSAGALGYQLEGKQMPCPALTKAFNGALKPPTLALAAWKKGVYFQKGEFLLLKENVAIEIECFVKANDSYYVLGQYLRAVGTTHHIKHFQKEDATNLLVVTLHDVERKHQIEMVRRQDENLWLVA